MDAAKIDGDASIGLRPFELGSLPPSAAVLVVGGAGKSALARRLAAHLADGDAKALEVPSGGDAPAEVERYLQLRRRDWGSARGRGAGLLSARRRLRPRRQGALHERPLPAYRLGRLRVRPRHAAHAPHQPGRCVPARGPGRRRRRVRVRAARRALPDPRGVRGRVPQVHHAAPRHPGRILLRLHIHAGGHLFRVAGSLRRRAAHVVPTDPSLPSWNKKVGRGEGVVVVR